jgi:NAD-dependent SIR2 family protein deacetylase
VMDREKAGKSSCRACGAKLPSDDFESTHNESMNRCSRCAMVSELISELIRKQVYATARPR